MKSARQLPLAYSLLSTTFISLCINIVIFEMFRFPISIVAIVLAALATIISAIVTVLTYRQR